MSQGEFIFNLMLCAVAILFAAHSTIAARRCVIAFFVGWLCYVSAWASDIHPSLMSPASILYQWGFDVYSKNIWMLADVLAGLYVMEQAAGTWWGRTLWLSYIAQGGALILWSEGAIEWDTYEPVVTAIFRAQVAIFIITGARGVRDRIMDFIDNGRHALDQARAAS